MTDYAIEAGAGTGVSLTPTAAEAALWPYLAPFRRAKSGIWLQAQPKSGLPFSVYDNPPVDAPADFWAVDRIGGRKFVTQNTTAQPKRGTDPTTGRSVFFGASGIGMACASQPDAAGVEQNNKSLFVPGTGYSVWAKFRCPAPSTTLHGVAYGPNPGGILLGGASATLGDDFRFEVGNQNGNIGVYNRGIALLWGAATDYRDAAQHTFVGMWDAQAQTFTGYVDGARVVGTTANSPPDIETPNNGSDRPVITSITSAPTGNFVGEWSAIGYVAAPVFNDAGARTALLNMLATI